MQVQAKAAEKAISAGTKKPWVRPAMVVLPLKEASGANPGPLCDRYGSLSHGTNRPR